MGNILKNSDGDVLLNDGLALEITSLIDDDIDAQHILSGKSILGVNGTVRPFEYPARVATIKKTAVLTENYATSEYLKILGSDDKLYSLEEWNDIFAENGYTKTGMITPDAIVVTTIDDHQEALYWNNLFTGRYYEPTGSSRWSANVLPVSYYGNVLSPCGLSTTSGTDSDTNKAYSITVSDSTVSLYTANTKETFVIPKITYDSYIFSSTNTAAEWAEARLKYTTWRRHRLAVATSVTTSKADGTIGELAIYNSSGTQAAIAEDMFFWVKNDSNVWVNTNLKPVYNNLSAANKTTLYDAHVAAGINMMDTGVKNTSTLHTLSPGVVPPQAIAVDGVWKIDTPIMYWSTTAANRCMDNQALDYANSLGLILPSYKALLALCLNKSLISSIRSYMTTIEGRTIAAIPTSACWTVNFQGDNYGININPNTGTGGASAKYTKCVVLPSKYIDPQQ